MKLSSLLIAMSLLFTAALFSKDATVDIKTSITCQSCVNSIETGLKDVEGIDKITANVDTKVVTIAYNDEKVTKEELTTKISGIGFTAEVVENGTEIKATKGDKKCGTSGCCSTKTLKKS